MEKYVQCLSLRRGVIWLRRVEKENDRFFKFSQMKEVYQLGGSVAGIRYSYKCNAFLMMNYM